MLIEPSLLTFVLRSPGEFVFRFPPNSPVFANLGLRWYGLLMAVAVLVALILTKFLAEQRRLEPEPGKASERVEQLTLWVVAAGFIGARLYYVLTHLGDFQANPLSAFAIWQGGIIIHGGILGGALALYCFCRATGSNAWRYADILTPGLILGQAIGRWGNFFNSEAYGAPLAVDSTWPVAQFIPPEMRVVDVARGIDHRSFELFHPIFLYEFGLNLILFGILMALFWRWPKLKDGTWVWTYVTGYSLIRIPYEMLRVAAVAYVGNTDIKVAYLASALGIVLGVSMLVYLYRFRHDPDLEAISLWMSEVAGLDSQVALDVVRRTWQLQQKHRQADIADRVSLAMPYFPGGLAQKVPISQRQEVMRQLMLRLEGKLPANIQPSG